MKMKAALMISLIFGCLLGVVQAGSGLSVEAVSSQVKPGEMFEFRVTMERETFGRFELKIPGHEHLHRVAVEQDPVRLQGGIYRQRETWWLQADSSGEFVIDEGVARLETEHGIEEVNLEPIRVEVLPFAATDESNEPLDFPEADDVRSEAGQLGWVVGGVLLALGCWWWMLKSNRTGVLDQVPKKSEQDGLLDRLAEGKLDQKDLERLMLDRDWSGEAKEALAEVVYGGGKDMGRLVAILRKEVGR